MIDMNSFEQEKQVNLELHCQRAIQDAKAARHKGPSRMIFSAFRPILVCNFENLAHAHAQKSRYAFQELPG